MGQTFKPRASQEEILAYQGGTMGISAVPGSGKTHVLSALAAKIIGSGELGTDQEVLIVTLVNSAVDNFSSRIGGFIRNMGLIPNIGYRVRTLHGLAHDIVRENPSLVGLENKFGIVDEREAEFMRRDAVTAWVKSHPVEVDNLVSLDLDETRRERLIREKLPGEIEKVATAFIRTAKDRRLSPEALRQRLDSSPLLPLAEMGWDIYANYQRALMYRGAVDFDDLIRLALEALTSSSELLGRFQRRFPYILEDEAQDSSELQERILGLISTGNWVRVGDPNQAIFETFTTAKPEYLLDFIHHADYSRDLPVSGRSQPSIIDLANRLIRWVEEEHPREECRNALTTPFIRPTEADDPQPNPPDNPMGITLFNRKFTPDEELNAVITSLTKWLPAHTEKTVAVLVPSNRRGIDLVNRLKLSKLPYVEYISSTNTTRMAAGALANLCAYLADPVSPTKLGKAYEVWRREWREDNELKPLYDRVGALLRKCEHVETYLAPVPGYDWLKDLQDSASTEEEVLRELLGFRENMVRWQMSTLLPIDQMLLALAQEIFTEPADIALSHKLALILRQAAMDHREWRLPELVTELGVVARNERKLIGFSSDDTGFDPSKYKGKVVVCTMHKAKGLEWDRVYLTSVNNYDFPSGMTFDSYLPEKYYFRDRINLEAEALAELNNAISSDEYAWQTRGEATIKARLDFARERLRLLYVGITRAREELVMTWNTGRGEQRQALPFVALEAAFNGIMPAENGEPASFDSFGG